MDRLLQKKNGKGRELFDKFISELKHLLPVEEEEVEGKGKI